MSNRDLITANARVTTLRLRAEKDAWLSNEFGKNARAVPAVLGGKVVHRDVEFGPLAPTLLKAMPGHDHAASLGVNVPAADARSSSGTFGSGCRAV